MASTADERRPFCAELSLERAEPLVGTASRVEHWLLLEYRGLWPSKVMSGSLLSDDLKAHRTAQLRALPHSRLVFIRRPERRKHPAYELYAARTAKPGRRLLRAEFERYDDLLDLDLARMLSGERERPLHAVEHPIFIVCTHGKRDRCCARYGLPLYDALRAQVEPTWVWQSTHVGGDRFAANLVCVREGLYYGRVGGADVWPLVDDYLGHRIYLERFRGRSSYPFPAQAAERAVRAETGLTGIDDLDLLLCERTGAEAWAVRFRAAARGVFYELDVQAEPGDFTYLTCSAARLQRPRRFVTRR